MVDGNNVYILESMFNGRNGYLKGIMERFYGGDVGCDSDTSSDYNNRCNILASSTNIIRRESIIAVGEFNVLNDNIG
jgi:hypothetical protein